MVSIRGLAKPQYLFRPSQIVRRLLQEIAPRSTVSEVQLPWGFCIVLDRPDTVSEAILSQGMYDLVTTEVLWRLTSRGERVVDVGANIGYFTSLFAFRTGSAGEVFAFEPHPKTYQVLRRNINRWARLEGCGRIVATQAALSDTDATAILSTQDAAGSNASHAYIRSSDGPGVPVQTIRFHSHFGADEEFGVVKVDAEGHETAIFEGMAEHLSSRRIRDIVYEENAGYPAASHKRLEAAGYALFAFEQHLSGPRIIAPTSVRPPKRACDAPPSYLATRDPERARNLLSPRGWQSLKAH